MSGGRHGAADWEYWGRGLLREVGDERAESDQLIVTWHLVHFAIQLSST